jgi:hypothetical protein
MDATQNRKMRLLVCLALLLVTFATYDDATKTAAKAIALAKKSGQDQLAAQIQPLLELYQQHRAFHH